jgi:hypothetical protein
MPVISGFDFNDGLKLNLVISSPTKQNHFKALQYLHGTTFKPYRSRRFNASVKH